MPSSPPRSSGSNSQNGLAQQKLQAEVAALQAELDKLTKQTDLLAKRATLKEAERKAQLDEELAPSREKLEKMKLTNDLAAAEFAGKSRELTQHEQELKVRHGQSCRPSVRSSNCSWPR